METTANQNLTLGEELAQFITSMKMLREQHDEDHKKSMLEWEEIKKVQRERTQEWEEAQKRRDLEWGEAQKRRELEWEKAREKRALEEEKRVQEEEKAREKRAQEWEKRALEEEKAREKRALEEERRDRKREQDWEEIRKAQREADRKIGELGGRFGELAEHLVAPGIVEKFNKLGYHFFNVSPGGVVFKDDNGKALTQVDILLENTNCIMAVEVKTSPKTKDIEHHVKRLEIIREHRNKHHNDKKKIFGAIAGAVYGEIEKQETIAAGFYVLEQSGDTMRMNIPDNFEPKEW